MSNRTYRYFHGDPLYPFGYGLSYTKFSYANPHVNEAHGDQSKDNADAPVTVSVDVKNDGAMAGDEVVELYLTHTGFSSAPLRALQGFQRVHLLRGQKKTVTFTLRDRDLSIVDSEGKHRIVPGAVQVWIGGGQPIAVNGAPAAAGVATQFALTRDATLPD
jgi:beta-glucosidase